MIRCHLSRMMGEHKMKISDVARETGLNRSTITALYQENAARIEIDVLEKLCQLFDCKIEDIFEYVKSDE
ncbi:MAG: helix-turn-helix transcriptional regulator [Sulfuritalea sp.]|nr:helix-turn-helix transcriptional regulator [Sulfuritalea sp.]